MYPKKYTQGLQDKYIILITDLKVPRVLYYKIIYLFKNNLINFIGKGQDQANYNRKIQPK